MTIPVCRPKFGQSELEALQRVLASGQLVQATEVQRFESRLAKLLEVEHGIAASSGSAALHLAFVALGFGPGDEIIMPDLTFPAPAFAAIHVGATPVLVDIVPTDFSMNLDQLRAALSPKTRGICLVHQFGIPTPVTPLEHIATENGLILVEDAACALGARTDDGQYCGARTAVGCFSFHPRKILTSGEGGLLTTNDEALALRLRALRNHGISASPGRRFQFETAGFNYRMSELHAAVGNCQLELLRQTIADRRKLYQIYRQRLELMPLELPTGYANPDTVVQSLVVILPTGTDRKELIHLLASEGIQTTIGSLAQHRVEPIARRARFNKGALAQSSRIAEHGLTLPLYPGMPEQDVHRVCDALEGGLTIPR